MSLQYVEAKINEALRMNRGHVAKARKQIELWAQTDLQLLKALTQNHFSGIVAYHVDRVASGRSERAKTKAQNPQSAAMSSPGDKPFGMEVLKAIVERDATVFGLETYSSPPRRGQASQRHKDAIAKIIQSSQGKGA